MLWAEETSSVGPQAPHLTSTLCCFTMNRGPGPNLQGLTPFLQGDPGPGGLADLPRGFLHYGDFYSPGQGAM